MILAIDSSSVSAGAALVREGVLVAEAFQNVGLTHSVSLGPLLADMMKNSQSSWEEIHSIAVSNGPGSFTGLRIGIASALGLAEAIGLPCVGVSSLYAAAYNALCCQGLVQAVMDARRGEVYAALFCAENGTITRLEEDEALPRDELLRRREGQSVIWVGDAAAQCVRTIGGDLLPVRTAVSAVGVALCAHHGHTRDVLPPRYLRLPQAERERLEAEGKV